MILFKKLGRIVALCNLPVTIKNSNHMACLYDAVCAFAHASTLLISLRG